MDYTFSGSDYIGLKQDALYIWKRGDKFLYIGISQCIGRRIFTHTIIDIVEPVLPEDVIEIYVIESLIMKSMEKIMIKQHRPKYNTIHNDYEIRKCEKCPVLFKPGKHNQKYCTACGPKQINRKWKN